MKQALKIEQTVFVLLVAVIAGLLSYKFALEVWCWAYGLIY